MHINPNISLKRSFMDQTSDNEITQDHYKIFEYFETLEVGDKIILKDFITYTEYSSTKAKKFLDQLARENLIRSGRSRWFKNFYKKNSILIKEIVEATHYL